MRTIVNMLGALAVLATGLALMPVQATACPNGYFQCGGVCCPSR